MGDRDGRVVLQLSASADPITDAVTVMDALVRCDAVHLFDIEGRVMLVRGGELVPVTGPVLREIAGNVVTKRLVNRGAGDQENWQVEYVPVARKMVRIILVGKDPRTGDEVKGGNLASRVSLAGLARPTRAEG
jgi:hypothetical protein